MSGLILGLQQAWGRNGQWSVFMGMQQTHMRANSGVGSKGSVGTNGDGQFSPPLYTVANARISSAHAGLGAAWQSGAVNLSVGAAHTWHRLRNQRQLAMGGMTDALSSRYSARALQVFGELAVEGASLTPFGRLAWVQTRTSGYSEAGGPAALALQPSRHHVLFSTLGIRAQHTVSTSIGEARVYGELAWRHAAGNIRPASHQQFANLAARGDFVSYGLPISRHAIQLQAGVTAQLSERVSLRMAYAGQYGSGLSEHGVQVGLMMSF